MNMAAWAAQNRGDYGKKGGGRVYPYHNRIKQRIRSGELIGHYYTDCHPRIGKALVLVFRSPPFERPIRPHRWAEYQEFLNDPP